MKIFHLNASDMAGGAARAAYSLHQGLRHSGIDSRMLVGSKISNDPYVYLHLSDRESTGHRFWRATAPYFEEMAKKILLRSTPDFRSLACFPGPIGAELRRAGASIVNLHWICGGMIRPEALPTIRKPLVWTLHDQWPFSGSEHYAIDSNFNADGDGDHDSSTETVQNVDKWMRRRKTRAYNKISRLWVVAPSRWLAGSAKKSALFHNRPVRCIPYGIDHRRFHPINKAAARKVLNLPDDGKYLLFAAADGTSDPRKGFSHLQAALFQIAAMGKTDRLRLLVLGGMKADISLPPQVAVHDIGRLRDDISLSVVYSAADVLACPSRRDNLPLTAIEALSCGTPVVSFSVGGLPDIVDHHKTGYLARPFDNADFALGVHAMITATDSQKISARARATVETRLTLEHQAAAYIDLYNEILESKNCG